ncbi:MAG: hypothetical protein ACF8CQ_15180, partial [Rhodopirellula sp. JB044]|uniref:hypothetical protein n=1 Tax=Rhodopirellula sp. JB044 TaxID=3342844 RepID=UPI00370BF422
SSPLRSMADRKDERVPIYQVRGPVGALAFRQQYGIRRYQQRPSRYQRPLAFRSREPIRERGIPAWPPSDK